MLSVILVWQQAKVKEPCEYWSAFIAGSWHALQQCKGLPGNVTILPLLDGEQNWKATCVQGKYS